jgi:hypothetical protein
VKVGRSGEGSLQRWCRINASVLTQEGRRQDKALLEDEAEVAELVLAQWEGSVTRRGIVMTLARGETAPGLSYSVFMPKLSTHRMHDL